MKNDLKWLIGAFAFIIALILALVLYQKLSSDYGLPEEIGGAASGTNEDAAGDGSADTDNDSEKYNAPDFTVYDIDGNAVKLSDFLGKPIVLNFWASWCGPCKAEMPSLDNAAKEYTEVTFLMVNLTDGSRETLDGAKKFIEDSGYTFPVYFDTELSAAYAYGTSSIPVTYFIDAEGNLATSYMGTIPESVLMQGIAIITE